MSEIPHDILRNHGDAVLLVHKLQAEIEWLRATLAAQPDIIEPPLKAENERLRAMVEQLVELCLHANEGAFLNGVTDSTGSMDEGDVRAGMIIDEARATLRQKEAGDG